MNYEEKYKEALDLMKDCVPDENGLVHVRPEDIFPELEKSEDEKMIKDIMDCVESCYTDEYVQPIRAWLEKQVQKPAEWSEEDERNLQGVIDEIEANKNQAPDYDIATYDRFLSWLKSLKERYT